MEEFPSMTYSQKNIANYILEHMNQIAFCTLEDLAAKIGVSTTTIIRFAKNFGYSGYSEMQKEIQQTSGGKSTLPERILERRDIPDDQLLRNSFENDIRNIQETMQAQKKEDLETTVNIISQARHIYILGMRSSYACSYYLASRLGEICKNVRFIQATGMMYPEEIVDACKDDVLIAYLFPRYSRLSATMISWMRAQGVRVILITSMNDSPVKDFGDIVLPCAVSSISYKNSFSAPLSLTNYLILALSQKDKDEALDTLMKTEEILDQGYYLGL